MVILHEQERAMGRLRGHAPNNEAATAQLCSSLSVCSQYTSFKGGNLESILKRFTEESTVLCVIFESEKYYITVSDLKPANPTGKHKDQGYYQQGIQPFCQVE